MGGPDGAVAGFWDVCRGIGRGDDDVGECGRAGDSSVFVIEEATEDGVGRGGGEVFPLGEYAEVAVDGSTGPDLGGEFVVGFEACAGGIGWDLVWEEADHEGFATCFRVDDSRVFVVIGGAVDLFLRGVWIRTRWEGAGPGCGA